MTASELPAHLNLERARIIRLWHDPTSPVANQREMFEDEANLGVFEVRAFESDNGRAVVLAPIDLYDDDMDLVETSIGEDSVLAYGQYNVSPSTEKVTLEIIDDGVSGFVLANLAKVTAERYAWEIEKVGFEFHLPDQSHKSPEEIGNFVINLSPESIVEIVPARPEEKTYPKPRLVAVA